MTEQRRPRSSRERAADQSQSPTGDTAATRGSPPARDTAPARTAEELPWIDDPVSRLWVVFLVAVFGAIFLYGLLFGRAGMLTPVPTPSPTPVVTPSPQTTPTPALSPTPAGSPSPGVSPDVSPSPGVSPGASPTPATPSPVAS